MSWVTVIWSMVAAASLTLAGMHLLVWFQRRSAWGNLLFAMSAVGTAFIAACEFWMTQAHSPEEFGTALRWLHVPGWVMMLGLIGFVRVYLRAGRPWLAWTAIGVRTLSLLLNFLFTPNLNYREITSLRHVQFLGETISVAEGVVNPWMLVGQAAILLFLLFILDASISVWRRGDRRQALILGGSMSLFVTLALASAILTLWRVVDLPLTVSWSYLGIIMAMGIELSRDAQRTAQLASDLQESEQRAVMAADAAKLGFWSRDLEHGHIWATESWRKLFGFARSEPLKFDAFLQRVHPDDRESLQASLSRSQQTDSSYETEFRLLMPDGEIRWIASRGGAAPGQGRKATHMRGVSMNITDRKQLESDALLQRTELAHLSRVTMLGELSGSLAHELNQPLASILSNAQAALRFLARNPADLAEIRNILQDIVEDDKRAGEVIRRLRGLLRKEELQYEALDLNEVVLDVLKLMRSDLLHREVSIVTEFAAAIPPVSGDLIQVQQVLVNLLMNGCDAMEGVQAARLLSLRTEAAADGTVEVSIADHGKGIPPDDLERIFEPFVSTKAEGLGLGLAVCRTIITAHNGRLWATNNADGGATLHFAIPYCVTPS